MTVTATNPFLKVIYFLCSFAVLAFIYTSSVLAQASPSPEASPEKPKLDFPISELGNCASVDDCKTFCSDESNQEACINFAKKKGFYREDNSGQGNARSRLLLQKAQEELGCSSEKECREICKDEANIDKCQAFAKKFNLNSDSQKLAGSQILEKAKSILGCTSPETCRDVCEKEENREKCSQFAKSAGLKGGIQKVGPGGCKSETECKDFCSNPDNFESCQKFGGGPNGEFRGPGGCNSKKSCENFCKENESKCQELKERFEDRRELEKKCLESPEECEKKKKEIEKEVKGRNDEFCINNPETCKAKNSPNPNAFENANERAKFCRENPGKCTKENFSPNPQSSPRNLERESFKERKGFEKREDSTQRGKPDQNNSGPGSLNSGSGSQNSGSGEKESGDEEQENEQEEPEIKGASTSPSVFQQLWNFFFK